MSFRMRCTKMRITVTDHHGRLLRQICGEARVRAPRLLSPRITQRQCSAVSSTANGQPADDARPSITARIKDFFCPFHDTGANTRFMALALGGLLCSVATLIHDSYLPVFMRDELGMSNSV